MKKILSLLLIIIILIGISGCSFPGRKTNTLKDPGNMEVSKSTQGITISPYVGTTNRVNYGDFVSIRADVIHHGNKLTGDPIIARIYSCEQMPKEDGSRKLYVKDNFAIGEDTAILTGLVAAIKGTCKVQADVCYTYQTQYALEEFKIVNRDERIEPEKQSGPLNIVEIVQDISEIDENTKKIKFEVYVQNLGQGSVLDEGGYDNHCSGDVIKRNDKYMIGVYKPKFMLGGRPLSCKPKSGDTFKITYIDKKQELKGGYFVCEINTQNTLNGENRDLYPRENLNTQETPIKITLDYGYRYYETVDVEVLD